MNITKNIQENKLIISIEGRLDSTTAPQLDKEIDEIGAASGEVELDFSKLEYISSAGLRILLKAHTMVRENATLKITNANETVKEVLDITGFTDILNIE